MFRIKLSHKSLSLFTRPNVRQDARDWQRRSLFYSLVTEDVIPPDISFCFPQTMRVIRVCNSIRVSKYDRFAFWVNYLYIPSRHICNRDDTSRYLTGYACNDGHFPLRLAASVHITTGRRCCALSHCLELFSVRTESMGFGSTLCDRLLCTDAHTSETPAAWATHQKPALSSQSQTRAPVTCAPQNKEETNTVGSVWTCITAPTKGLDVQEELNKQLFTFSRRNNNNNTITNINK